jgi:hypothetical protein
MVSILVGSRNLRRSVTSGGRGPTIDIAGFKAIDKNEVGGDDLSTDRHQALTKIALIDFGVDLSTDQEDEV